MAVNETLYENCMVGNLEEVRRALENDGADPNSVEQEGSTYTCLMVAARHNRAEVVSLFLNQRTIEVNRREDYYNRTACMWPVTTTVKPL